MVALPNIGAALCSTPQFGWRPLLECCAVMLSRRESRWNLQGCPKLTKRSQPLVGRSSLYYEDMWRKYRCLTSFFSDCRYMPQLRRYSPIKLSDGAKMAIFLRPVFSASRVQHISDMHSKFALRPHHVWKYGRHPISDRWDLARKKKKKERRQKSQGKNIMSALLHRATIMITETWAVIQISKS